MKASITQPWKKYHREKPIRDFNVEQKLCTLLWDANKSNEKHNAVNYMGITGNTWTYKEIFSMSRQLASAYAHAGVQKGDTVLIATVSGIEEITNLLEASGIMVEA